MTLHTHSPGKCSRTDERMLHPELLALPGASSLLAKRLQELPRSEGHGVGVPSCVLQPPSTQELVSPQGLLPGGSCSRVISAKSRCWLRLCSCLGMCRVSQTETEQGEDAQGNPAQGLMQG